MKFQKKLKIVSFVTVFAVAASIFSGFSGFSVSAEQNTQDNQITETRHGAEVVFSGSAGKNGAKKDVSLLIYNGHNYTQGSNQNIIYFDQGKTDTNGDYAFTVKKTALSDAYTVQTSVVGVTGVSVLKSQAQDSYFVDFSDYTGGLPTGFVSSNNQTTLNNNLKSEVIDTAHGVSLVSKGYSWISYLPEDMLDTSRVTRVGFSIYAKDKTTSLVYTRLLDSRWKTQDNSNDPYMYESFNATNAKDENGNITKSTFGYYRGSQGWQINTICDYSANKWYDIEMWLDTPRKQITYAIKDNGTVIGEGETDISMPYDLKGILFNLRGDTEIAIDDLYMEYMDYDKRKILLDNGEYVPESLKLPCDISVTSDNPGNIFFGGETAELDLNVKNLSADKKTYKLCASVKDRDGAEVWTQTVNPEIDGNGNYVLKLLPTINKYGVYTVDISLNDSVVYTADLSRCVKCDYINQKLGVCAHYDRDGGDPVDTVDLAKAAGISSIRADWWRAESLDDNQNPVYTDVFKTNDRFSAYIAESDKIGVDKLALIGVNSSLYPDEDGGLYTSDEALTALENYCEWFARTYKDTIKYIEVGNEIDYTLNKDRTQIPPEDYYKTLKAAYKGIKKGNPNAKVLLSSIFIVYDTRTVNGIQYKCLDFLKELLDMMKKDGKYYFDIVATHPYFIAGGPESVDRWSNNLNWITKSLRLKDTLAEYGLTSGENKKEIWATEMGYHNCPGGYNYSEEQSAAYMIRFLMLNDMYDLYDKIYFYCLYNEGTDPNYDENNFGLLKTWKKVSTPLAAKAVYPTLTFRNKLMQGATYTGTAEAPSSNMSNKLYSAEFKDNKRSIKVVWNADDLRTERVTTENIPISEKTTYIYDMYGNLTGTYTGQTSVTLTVGREPIYIVTDDSDFRITANGGDVASAEEFKQFKKADFEYNGADDQSGIMVIAQYKQDRLINIKTATITNGNASCECDYETGCDRVKVMAFKDLNQLVPLVQAKEF